MTDSTTRVRVHADTSKCAASGNCARILPAVFDQDPDDGTVRLLDAYPPADLTDDVIEAVDTCPTGAIEADRPRRP